MIGFDPITLMWAPIAAGGATPKPRFDHTMSVAGDSTTGHVVVVGGRDVRGAIDDVCTLDIAHNVWAIVHPLSNPMRPIGLYSHSAVAVKTATSWKVFLFGGLTGLMRYSERVYCYDTNAQAWVVPEGSREEQGKMMTPCEYSALALDPVQNRVLILGGWAEGWIKPMRVCSVQDIVGPTYAVTGVWAVRESYAEEVTGLSSLHSLPSVCVYRARGIERESERAKLSTPSHCLPSLPSSRGHCQDGLKVTIGPLSGGQDLLIGGLQFYNHASINVQFDNNQGVISSHVLIW